MNIEISFEPCKFKEGELVFNPTSNDIVLITELRDTGFDGLLLQGKQDKPGHLYNDYPVDQFELFRGKIILEQ